MLVSASSRQTLLLSAVLLAAFLFLVAFRLHLPFLEPEESLYAEIPREMLAEGSSLLPVLHGEAYLDKPPLLYWAVIASYKIFGVHVWSARLVPALAAWGLVIVAFAWARAWGGWCAGLFSATVLTLTTDFIYRGPMLTMNGLLALFTTIALASGHQALRGDRFARRWWLISAIATGLGILTKGLVAGVIVAVPLVLFPRLIRGHVKPSILACLVYLGVAAVVAAPWFAAVNATHPDFAEYFFWKHHVERFTHAFDHVKPAYYYLPQVFLGGMPWILLLAVLARRQIRERGPVGTPGTVNWYAILTAAWILAFFSASGSKRPVYLVPFWPVFAVGIGNILTQLWTEAEGKGLLLTRRVWSFAVAMTGVLILGGVVFWLPVYHDRFGLEDVERTLAAHDPSTPIYCFPHHWNSLEFAFPEGRLRTFRDTEQALLLDQLRSVPRAILIVEKGATCDTLKAELRGKERIAEEHPGNLVTLLVVETSPNRRE